MQISLSLGPIAWSPNVQEDKETHFCLMGSWTVEPFRHDFGFCFQPSQASHAEKNVGLFSTSGSTVPPSMTTAYNPLEMEPLVKPATSLEPEPRSRKEMEEVHVHGTNLDQRDSKDTKVQKG